MNDRSDASALKSGAMESGQSVSVREAVIHLLRELRMTTVFGNPGSTELRLFRDWPADFRYILGLQESSVVAMADGYAQATRNAAFLNLHSAAGVGHALGSVFTAYRNQTPLVISAGQQTRAMFQTEPYLFARAAAEFPKPYVKWSIEPARGEDVPAAIAQAYYIAMQKPCGPVFVSVPEDDWERPAELLPAREVSVQLAPDPRALGKLVQALASSRSPALVVGAAVDQDNAWDLAVQLAEHLRAPVWVSPMSGRCSFPEDHPLFAGFLPPLRQPLSDRLAAHDVVLVLGAPVFTYHVHTGGSFVAQGSRLFHLTDDAEQAARAPVGDSIVCTLRLGMECLLDELPAMQRSMPATRTPPPTPSGQDPISGEFVLHTLSRLLPRDAVLVEEAPIHRHALHDHLPIRASGGFYAGASGGLGWALPAAVGVALAAPTRKVVALIGDGSSLYSIQALWTAAQHKLPITFIILNNQGYAALKAFSAKMGIHNAPGHDVTGVDFTHIAKGFGCSATRVEHAADLAGVLKQALAAEHTSLIDIQVDREVQKLY